jgi:hypothetical protein
MLELELELELVEVMGSPSKMGNGLYERKRDKDRGGLGRDWNDTAPFRHDVSNLNPGGGIFGRSCKQLQQVRRITGQYGKTHWSRDVRAVKMLAGLGYSDLGFPAR